MTITHPFKAAAIVMLTMAATFTCFKTQAKEAADTISVRRAFIELPTSDIPLLDRSSRMDLLDYYDDRGEAQVVNEYDGISRLESIDSDYISIAVTPISTLQMKIFKDKKGNDIVMTIYTTGVNDGASDSEVAFYNASMQKLPTEKYMEFPKLKDFFEIPRGYSTKMKEIEEVLPFHIIEYTASAGSDIVEARLNLGDFINLEDKKLVSMFLLPKVDLVWNGNKLKVKK